MFYIALIAFILAIITFLFTLIKACTYKWDGIGYDVNSWSYACVFAAFICFLVGFTMFFEVPISSAQKTTYNITVKKGKDSNNYIVEFNNITLDSLQESRPHSENKLKTKEYFSNDGKYYLTYHDNVYITCEKFEDYVLYVPVKTENVQVNTSTNELENNYETVQTVR